MTYVPHSTIVRRVPTHSSVSPPPTPAQLVIGTGLRGTVTAKRAQIAALEADWVAMAETEAGRQAGRGVRTDDRATWDGPFWARYLAAAEAIEPTYKPHIKQLLREIECLERLLAVSSETGALAS